MENWYGAALCKEARNRSRGVEKRKLTAIFAGVSAGAALATTIVYHLLENGIAQTSGLAGLGMRSILQTATTFLSSATSLLAPFWNLGFFFVTLLWARNQQSQTRDLLAGFRRFGAYLRLLLSRGLLTVGIGFISVYISSYIYMMTPWSAPVMEFAQSANMDIGAANTLISQMDMAQMDALLHSMLPMLIIWGVLCLVLAVPMLYKFRMAEFFLLEDKRMGALRAMFFSAHMLRKRRWKLFVLDLRFWWYYGLQTLCLLLYSADLWLPLLGVNLPVSGFWLAMGSYVLYLAALFALQTFLLPQVQTAYALAYETLLHTEPVMPKPVPQPDPKSLPWDEF